MADQRNRIIKLVQFIESQKIQVNICKNKARGNKGLFKFQNKSFRIDIAKGLTEKEILGVLVHEFAHFIHYKYDNTLESLEFIFNKNYQNLEEELINLTVETIPKDNIKPLFDKKTSIEKDIQILVKDLKQYFPNFKRSEAFLPIETKLSRTPFKYLLKYDRVKVLGMFKIKYYSINTLNETSNISKDCITYLNLKSKQRALKRINSKISRLNKYYNTPTELFARSIEMYIFDKSKTESHAPNVTKIYTQAIKTNKIPMLTSLVDICEEN